MARVHLPEPLREAAGLPPVADLPGATVAEVLAAVRKRWPEVGERLLSAPDRLALGVTVFVGQVDVRRRGGLLAQLAPSEEIHVIVPLLVGR